MDTSRAQGGVVVIGAGLAGLWTALKLAPHPVTVITAGHLGDGSSSWAQGGLAAAIGPDDHPRLHAEDTIAAGAGLCDPHAVDVLCESGRAAVEGLAVLGVPFDRDQAGAFRLGREGAHRRHRIVHVGGDEAGAAIVRTLAGAARKASHIEICERMVAEKILTSEGRVSGALVWDIQSQSHVILTADKVVLATGGLGGLYAVTTNPLYGQGHGLALAAEAGATLRDLEFVQFHPTGLDVGRDPAPLATEAIRGEGGQLVDAHGNRFMDALHDDAELAPRDVVARGVARAIGETGGAFLDVRSALGPAFRERFPTVDAACRDASLYPETDLIPIAPAAHYHMGGIKTGLDAETDVAGLYAVGECASTGVHGANRLASNSLLEALVFGERAAEHIKAQEERWVEAPASADEDALSHKPARELMPLRRMMAGRAGLLRSTDGLEELLDLLDTQHPSTVSERLAIVAATGVTHSALARQESRGAHQRLDYPETDQPRHSEARLTGKDWSITFVERPS
ncbi:MAG: L-aspartate oxidase [Pseudomonadota bacterium]